LTGFFLCNRLSVDMNKNQIVVTGGGGFIGSVVVWFLNRRGFEEILVVDEGKNDNGYKNLKNLKYSDYFSKDRFIEKLEGGILDKSIKGIIHLGACSDTTEGDWNYLKRDNYEYTMRLAMWSIARKKRFVYASSAATYGMGENGFSDDHSKLKSLKPLNLYGKSKQIFDIWALENTYLARIAGLKYFNVFGPNEYHKGDMRSMVIKSFEQIKETGRVKLFKSNHPEYEDGEQLRDFIYVKDAVEMTLFVYDNPGVNGIINIGTGVARSFNDLAVSVFDAMGKEVTIEYIDMPEKLKSQYQNFTEADISKIRDFGYNKKIFSLEEGVDDYVKNYLLTPHPYL
jgi:ADP-L-glycero-D-manno-heptose 6-epimerase